MPFAAINSNALSGRAGIGRSAAGGRQYKAAGNELNRQEDLSRAAGGGRVAAATPTSPTSLASRRRRWSGRAGSACSRARRRRPGAGSSSTGKSGSWTPRARTRRRQRLLPQAGRNRRMAYAQRQLDVPLHAGSGLADELRRRVFSKLSRQRLRHAVFNPLGECAAASECHIGHHNAADDARSAGARRPEISWRRGKRGTKSCKYRHLEKESNH